MSRSLSMSLLNSMYSEETGDFPIGLLTIDHADLSEPILVSSDATERVSETAQEIVYGTISRGDTYIFFDYGLIVPSDEEEGVPSYKISLANTTQEITDALRDLTSPPVILLEIVMASDPDTVEASWPEFRLTDSEWNRETVTGTISMDALLTEKMGYTYRPSTHPGVFK